MVLDGWKRGGLSQQAGMKGERELLVRVLSLACSQSGPTPTTLLSQISQMLSVTCSAPVNIAVVKYWGKREEALILPINSSLSATLDQAQLKTVTSVTASKTFENDKMWLNGKSVSIFLNIPMQAGNQKGASFLPHKDLFLAAWLYVCLTRGIHQGRVDGVKASSGVLARTSQARWRQAQREGYV
jgi:hypothetical protein